MTSQITLIGEATFKCRERASGLLVPIYELISQVTLHLVASNIAQFAGNTAPVITTAHYLFHIINYN